MKPIYMNGEERRQGGGGRAWAWGVAGVYAAFALSSVAFALFAAAQTMDLVSDDYYQRELDHQQHIERVRRARALPRETSWRAQVRPGGVLCSFPLAAGGAPVSGTIQLYRPDDARLDRHFAIALDGRGRQWLATGLLKRGLWRLRVQWQMGGEDYYWEEALEVP